MRYLVNKTFINPWGNEVSFVESSPSYVEYTDVDMQDNEIFATAVNALVADGSISPVIDEAPEVVTQEMLDANPQLAEYGVEIGSPITLATEAETKILDAKVAAADAAAEVSDEIAPAGEEVDQSVFGNIAPTGVEPRKRFRGQIVLAEGIREVGTQSFKHIALADGSQLDLTDDEYVGVKVSFPPTK